MKKNIKFLKVLFFCFFIFLFSACDKATKTSESTITILETMEEKGLSSEIFQGSYSKSISMDEFAKILLKTYEEATQNKREYPVEEGEFDAIADKLYEAGLLDGLATKIMKPESSVATEDCAIVIYNFVNVVYPEYFYGGTIEENKDPKEAFDFCLNEGIFDESFDLGKLSRENTVVAFYNLTSKMQLIEKGSESLKNLTNLEHGDNFAIFADKVYFLSTTINEEFVAKDFSESGYISGKYLYIKDTQEEGLLARETNNHVLQFTVKNNFLFYLENDTENRHNIIKKDLETDLKRVIASDIGGYNFVVDGDWIYYIYNNYQIRKIRTDGDCPGVLYSTGGKGWISNVKATDGNVYFTNQHNGLMKITTDGLDVEIISNELPEEYLIYERKIYTLEKDGSSKKLDLFSINLDSKERFPLEKEIAKLYSNANGVYAYKNVANDKNIIYHIQGNNLTAIENSYGINVLLKNNASLLYFSDDKKIYYSVFRPVATEEFVKTAKLENHNKYLDNQKYLYTNILDMETGKTTALSGEDMFVNNYKELEFVYDKEAYRIIEDIPEKNKIIIKKADEVIKKLSLKGLKESEKEKKIHDYIVLNTKYGIKKEFENYSGFVYYFFTNQYNPLYIDTFIPDTHTPYGVLNEGYAVCQGYATTANLLFNMAGIESIFIEGTATNSGGATEDHSWNIVNIDGNYYHVDTTWDDPTPDVKGRALYDYYNLTDMEIGKDHHITAPENRPVCNISWK